MLCSLLMTALMLLALPGLWSGLTDGAPRVSERLKPARQITLTLWLVGDRADCQAWLRDRLTAFERANAGARVFLRRADETELYAPGAALPDAVLFSALSAPERALRPLTGATDGLPLSAGSSSGTLYALPVCYAPCVLAVPTALLPVKAGATATPTAAPKSYFSFATATPDPVQPKITPEPPEIPWEALTGTLVAPEGTALQQLAAMCPPSMRAALSAGLAAQWDADGARRITPAPGAPRVLTLAAFRAAVAAGEALTGFVMTPAVSDRVLFAGAISERGVELLRALLSEDAQAALAAHGLFSARPGKVFPAQSALERELALLYQSVPLLPNAFAHTVEERDALCRSALLNGGDPVETLLRLR